MQNIITKNTTKRKKIEQKKKTKNHWKKMYKNKRKILKKTLKKKCNLDKIGTNLYMLVAIKADDDLFNCSTLFKTILHHQRKLANWREVEWSLNLLQMNYLFFPL